MRRDEIIGTPLGQLAVGREAELQPAANEVARRGGACRGLLVAAAGAQVARPAGATVGLRMDVAAVSFPGDAFEAAASELRPCLVVVDVTYLDEARVRPLMQVMPTRHFGSLGGEGAWRGTRRG